MKIVLAVALAALALQKTPSASDTSAAIVRDGVAVYAMLTNPGMYEAYVQSGTSDVGKVELRDADPATPLGKPASNILIPAFGSVELKAGGPFVLVTGLKSQPKAGDAITVTLMTDGGDKIPVTAVVK